MIKQGIAILSWLACIWLLSASGFGLVGNWALFFILGVPFVWIVIIAFSEWKWHDDMRRRVRHDRRIKCKMVEQKDKELYLRSIA